MSSQFSFLPTPLEGEHILSTMARWAKLQGETDSKRVLNRLSEHLRWFSPSYCYDPMFDDFLKHYGSNVSRIGLIELQTSLMYHSVLIRYKNIYAIESLKTYYSGGIKPKKPKKIKRLNPLTAPHQSKLAFSSLWRWCELCAKEDEVRLGCSYWHVAHQLPSTFTCYKHREVTLTEHCETCDFQFSDIRKYSAPPSDGKCLKCSSPMRPQEYVSNEHTIWLSETSFLLLNQGGGLTTPEFGHAMKNGLSMGFSKRCAINPKAPIFVADDLQREFNEWFFNNQLHVFFKQPELAIEEQVLSIETGRIQARRLPPISVLLWLRFFGAESLENRYF